MVVIAVAINTYLSCALQPLWLYRDASGLYKKTKYVMLIAAIENVVLSIVLGNFIGVAGVIFASAIARLSTYFWYEPKLLFKEYFDKSAWNYYGKMFINMVLVAISVLAIQYILKGYAINTWFDVFAKAAITGIICSAIFLGAYYRTEGAQNIILKAKTIFERRFA